MTLYILLHILRMHSPITISAFDVGSCHTSLFGELATRMDLSPFPGKAVAIVIAGVNPAP